MQCPRCQHENRPQAKFCEECGRPLRRTNASGSPGASHADLEREVEHLARALSESLEQQTATAEILRVISGSPTDVQPVFDVIVERAVCLCGARFGRVYRYDGCMIHMVAGYGLGAAGLGIVQQVFPRPASDDTIVGRVILTREPALIRNIEREEGVPALSRRMIEALETRSQVTIPMLRAGAAIGAMTLGWAEPEAFDEQQIALLQTFADQAVIAIENVRLFKELAARNRDLTAALDQQTATADVLRIIAQSPTELQPVLDAIATSAVRLCAASDAVIERLEDDRFYNAAHAGAQMKGLVGLPLPLSRRFPGGRAVLDRKRVILDDIHLVAETEYPDTLELLKLNTIHTVAEIPLLSEGKPLGSLAVLRA